MYQHQNVRYTITWIEGIAHYEFRIRLAIHRGEGNHGAAKQAIETAIAAYTSPKYATLPYEDAHPDDIVFAE